MPSTAKLNMSTAIILDVETHAKEQPEIIEAAILRVYFMGPPTHAPEAPRCERYCPSKPISLGAMAVHHITDEDVAGCEPSSFFEIPPCDFLIGYNVDFDWEAAGSPEGMKRIDCCALARAVWPDIDTYSQGALIYHLDRQNAKRRLQEAHSAATDVLLCKTILDAEIAATGATSWEHLWNLSEEARIPKTMYWGKHAGMAIEDLPADYKHWLLTKCNNPPIDQYLRKALTGDTKQRTLFCPR